MSHADELQLLATDVMDLLGTGTDGDGVAEAVTVRLSTRTDNYTTGVPSVSTKDLAVSAVIGPVRTSNLSGDDRGVIEYREFTVGASDLAAAMAVAGVALRRLAEGDAVVVAAAGADAGAAFGGSGVWPIVRAHPEVSGRLWRVLCRRAR